ncbi:hypothetical protein [Desulfosporosinus sp.]|uniref:hypothetical protein n=1 Tax=Desulfosporosinus sp. TaxID=157907 RepID=UPI0025C6D303|nr:hypothetical protein [Desulfosporosinus sp.]MBC2723323.1 hypothetical protein [Desulfosporosinus sp.]MBC2726239.1 hypothetical protein [Desulfosporosinus sp.]
MPSDLFTTSYLGSYAGLVAVTYLLVQFFKEPIRQRLNDWWIRILAVGFALTIQLFTLFVTGNFTVEAIGLAVLNSFLVAITAAGTHNISQPSTQQLTTTLNTFEPIIYKPQVADVSPPIITPQPKKSTEGDPVPQTVQD